MAIQQIKGLKREIGLLGLTFTGLAGVIGSGWLFTPVYAAQIAGPASILSWMIGGFMCLMLAMVLAEVGCMLPIASSAIRGAKITHGNLSSFMGSIAAFIGYVINPPIEATAVLNYVNNFYPVLNRVEDGTRVLTPIGIFIAILLLGAFVIINYLGVKWLVKSNTALTWWKLVIPIGVPIAFITTHFNVGNFTDYGGFFPHGVPAVFQAISVSGVVFSFVGFRAITELAGEAKNPKRNIPMALILTILITLAIYLLVQVAFIGAIGPHELKNGWSGLSVDTASGPFAALAITIGLFWLAPILYADAIISPSATGLLFTGAASRISYALSRNGYFPKIFERLNKNNVPGAGIILNFLVGCVFLFPFRGWQQLVAVCSVSILIGLAYTPVTLYSLRKNLPDMKRPFQLRCPFLFCLVSFCFANLMIYWMGWAVVCKVFILLIVLVVLFLICFKINNFRRMAPVHAKNSLWVWLMLGGLFLISYLGSYGGIKVLGHGWDQLAVIVWSAFVFVIAINQRVDAKETEVFVRQNISEAEAIDPELLFEP